VNHRRGTYFGDAVLNLTTENSKSVPFLFSRKRVDVNIVGEDRSLWGLTYSDNDASCLWCCLLRCDEGRREGREPRTLIKSLFNTCTTRKKSILGHSVRWVRRAADVLRVVDRRARGGN